MGIAVKFGINTTLVILEMVNSTRLRLVKFIPISNTTLVVFIPNFTATHAITSTNLIVTGSWKTYLLSTSKIFGKTQMNISTILLKVIFFTHSDKETIKPSCCEVSHTHIASFS